MRGKKSKGICGVQILEDSWKENGRMYIITSIIMDKISGLVIKCNQFIPAGIDNTVC
jgi:hypothetical protein